MAARQGQCPVCMYYLILRDGLIPGHAVHDDEEDTPYCAGSGQPPYDPPVYDSGWDHDPRDIASGAWESNRRRH